jgi:hypothetical protein
MAKRKRKMTKSQVTKAHAFARKHGASLRRKGINPWALGNAIERGTVKRRTKKRGGAKRKR